MTRVAAALVAALLPGAAVAACDEEWSVVLGALGSTGWIAEEEGTVLDDRGTCSVEGMVLAENQVGVDVGRLTWRLEGVEALEAGTGEMSLVATLDNLRIVPRVNDPWIGYMLAQQNKRAFIDGSLQARWNVGTGEVELASLSIDLPGDNAFRLGFRIGGMTPAMLSGQVGDLSALTLDLLSVEIENRGFADGLILGALVGQMAGVPGDPESVMAATRAEAAALVAALPDALFYEGGKDALTRLIADAPVPWGELFVQVSTEAPLPLSRFLALGLAPEPLAPEALLQAFEGAEILVSYIPAPEPE